MARTQMDWVSIAERTGIVCWATILPNGWYAHALGTGGRWEWIIYSGDSESREIAQSGCRVWQPGQFDGGEHRWYRSSYACRLGLERWIRHMLNVSEVLRGFRREVDKLIAAGQAWEESA